MKLLVSFQFCLALGILAWVLPVAISANGAQIVLGTEPIEQTAKHGSAKKFLKRVNKRLDVLSAETSEAAWAYETNITDHNSDLATEAQLKMNKALMKIIADSSGYKGKSKSEKRQLHLIKLLGGMPDSKDDQKELADLQAEMTKIYSTAKYLGAPLDPNLTDTLATSRDYDVLLSTYIGWRNVTGPFIKPLYEKFVTLSNQGAHDNGYDDAGALWRAGYDMSSEDFTELIEKVWNQVLPLYEQLHCYVRAKLAEKYGKDRVELEDGFMPAHLLGNMWSQDWSHIYDLLIPYTDVLPIDVTPELVKQGYDAYSMHRLSESFYKSLGYDPLPQTFWTKSMLTRPADREVVCHASAWDFGNDDLRIKMCTTVTQEDLLTIHHEQGHLYYDHHYRKQPALYRDAAADFFHEAIGDTMELSVVVPQHLKEIGLIKGDIKDSPEQTINAQLAVALTKIAVLPWVYLVDQWRWKVFSGEVKPEDYQTAWIKLVEKYQGLKRPYPSTPDDFDPGAKFHIPANVPYIRYFGAALIQFQFHAALCKTAGHEGPLHTCSIYGNKKAGKQFAKMLSLGRSKTWQEALRTASRGEFDTLDGGPILEYFTPLREWLEKQNEGRTCGWKKD
ncbi:uncharacterized protein SPPG_05286 [Spizellomyces punctatus DAOM BR117]|uniref:Angiotensin-converting enzyme n=1 Tax=Spizellomyces punctatus (strain DAOM BR117) TaxID=645134 RepID=A0A0L0HG82_SPIPD|nr:uncharacterized protein SPPG_05286 [Spizellomyces punctatus DAOM BR117]KNC99914.1 hypothetical protein SPPG_05286 [Spizellomyces punctatus DAOM BR117]|eukprot:XP_016607954.1 hypothetical protein SPPG_05286 [Spizellomyces punctatus DAOM BR117]